MALPVAHGLLGATIAALFGPDTVHKEKLKTILTAAAVAISPDLDYVFYQLLGWGENWHRTFSHSIVFDVAVGAFATIVVGPNTVRYFFLYSLAAISHPVLDAAVSIRGGVQFLWPFSHRMFNFGLFGYPNVFAGQPSLYTVAVRILECSLIEMMVFAPLFLLALWFKARTRRLTCAQFPVKTNSI